MAPKSLFLATAVVRTITLPMTRGFEGVHHIPKHGAFLVIANHRSFLDGMILTCELNYRYFRPFHTISNATPYRHWLLAWFLRSARCVPLRRGNLDGSIQMMRRARGYLQMGEPVVLFPEGHLGNGARLGRPRPGAALLALESGAPVVPIGLFGTEKVMPRLEKWPRPRRTVHYRAGPLLRFDEESRRYPQADADERKRLTASVLRRMMEGLSHVSELDMPRRIL